MIYSNNPVGVCGPIRPTEQLPLVAQMVNSMGLKLHDNPFGMRLTALMISKKIIDTVVSMSLLADHPNVCCNYLRSGVGKCSVEIH